MPKRRVDTLDGIRIELNERERELVEQAILVNGISGIARGLGNAIGGGALALGAVAGILLWKEGPAWFKDKMDLGTQEWLDENCSQEKYDAYIQTRTDEWIKAAKKQGRYAPAVGTDDHDSWRNLDPASGAVQQALTFQAWEEKAYPDNPPLLYDAWCNEKKAEITVKRRALVGTIFPPLNMIGIAQYGFVDWFSGRK